MVLGQNFLGVQFFLFIDVVQCVKATTDIGLIFQVYRTCNSDVSMDFCDFWHQWRSQPKNWVWPKCL